VADFVGASTLIEGTLVSRDTLEVAPGVRLPVALPRPAAPGTRARLLIRPEHVEIAPAPGAGTALAATVTSVTYLGDRLDVRVEVAPGVIVRAQAPSGLGLQAGDRTTVRLPPGAFLEVS
jgi:putative spermidine/putrescine transport system ATP-binding protein